MGSHNQRVEYGLCLTEYGAEDPRIVVLEADLGRSTMSRMFYEKFPERYFEMGIAEQNMTSFAAGLALTGRIPFTNSFAVFASGRAFEQIRQSVCTAKLNVKIVGSSSGMSDFGDGATHQSIEDFAIMNSLPNMTVLSPCDGVEVRYAVKAAIECNGPVYIRLCRNDLEDIYPADTEYQIGRPVVLRKGVDVTLFATGVMVHKAIQAAGILESQGISAQVVNVGSLKPLDGEEVIRLARGTRGVVICEEHSIYGGLNSILTYILRSEKLPIASVAVMDCFGQSAYSHEELLEAYKLTGEAIAAKAKGVLEK